MKSKILVLLPLLYACTISAQLTITPGAQFSITGNTQFTLHNTDLKNNGTFTTGNGIVTFSGNNISSINGNQPVQFYELEVNKENTASVILEREVGVTQRLLFSSGFLLLNGFNVDLGTTGHLDGENETSRVYGPSGGEVLFNVNLNSPTNSNPANLGLFITSAKDLGNVTIKRGHQSQTNNPGTGNSMLRYYDIIPTNNTGLNAMLRFRYFDGELNGLDENSMVLFESQDAVTWTNLGSSSRDGVANFVEKTNINSFGRFTLFNDSNPLPVHFISFNANCEGNNVVLTWKTAQEQNSSHFDIERSADGIRWLVIGNLPAAGNSNTEMSYSFTDIMPMQNGFYRIAEHDLNGRVQYSSISRALCGATDEIKLWPNPVSDRLSINIVTGNESTAVIRVFDSKGALIKMVRATVLPGSNQLSVDMKTFASGVYSLSVEWNNGQMKKTQLVLKQ